MVKIYKVRGCEELGEWDTERIKKDLADAELFVYCYESGSYDGSGFALWKVGNKYGYISMGHCSCNGPLEDLNSILYTLPQLKKIVEKAYYGDDASKVFARLKELQSAEA